MAEASGPLRTDPASFLTANNLSIGQVIQLRDGRAAVIRAAYLAEETVRAETIGVRDVWTVAKTAGVKLLSGGKFFWDHSARTGTFRPGSDRDFYVGRLYEDAEAADTTARVIFNVDPPYDLDIARDPFDTVIVGTQALGGLGLYRRGGSHKIILDATSEAQKVDAILTRGFVKGAKAIVEFSFNVRDNGAGAAVDVSLGVANATHADDADAIVDSVFAHLNSNDLNIYLESDDGTVEVNATDSTIDYAEGTPVEVWLDFRTPTDVQIYINGVLALPATIFNINASGTGLVWKPIFHVEKTSAADVYDIDLEFMRVRLAEDN